MKTLQEKIKEIKEIKKSNWRIKDRVAALEAAGYTYEETDPRYFEEDKYHYVCVACSRDWNRTWGYALIKK